MGLVALASLTPGVALAAIQAWAPAIIAAATLAGTAMAVATAAYTKARANEKRLTVVERLTPKRSTDAFHRSGRTSVSVHQTTPERGAVSETATLPPEGGAE